MNAIVTYINLLRAIHHAPPLILSQKLNWVAGNWSEYMARSGRFDHSFAPYGENIARIGGTNHTLAALRAVNMSYAEAGNMGGHFTQLVWKSSRFIGIGVANTSRVSYVTFEFDPPGNVAGQYGRNVLF